MKYRLKGDSMPGGWGAWSRGFLRSDLIQPPGRDDVLLAPRDGGALWSVTLDGDARWSFPDKNDMLGGSGLLTARTAVLHAQKSETPMKSR